MLTCHALSVSNSFPPNLLYRYSFMRRNVRRLHREVNAGSPAACPRQRKGSMEYSTNGRTKRRKAASLAELQRFYDAAIGAASEVLSTTTPAGGVASTPPSPRQPSSNDNVLTTSLAAALSSIAGEGTEVVSAPETADRGEERCTDHGGCRSGRSRSTLFPDDANRRQVTKTLTIRGEEFREAFRKKLEATGGTHCKLGSTNKAKADGASRDDAAGAMPDRCSLGKVSCDCLLPRQDSAGRAQKMDGAVASASMSPSETCHAIIRGEGRDEREIEERSPHKGDTSSPSFPTSTYPVLPGVTGNFPLTSSSSYAPYPGTPLTTWCLSSTLPRALACTDSPNDGLTLQAPARSLPINAVQPRIDTALSSEPDMNKVDEHDDDGGSSYDGSALSNIAKKSFSPVPDAGGIYAMVEGRDKIHLPDDSAPLMPYWRRRRDAPRGARVGGRRVSFSSSVGGAEKRASTTTPASAAAVVRVARYGIMQQRQFHRDAIEEIPSPGHG